MHVVASDTLKPLQNRAPLNAFALAVLIGFWAAFRFQHSSATLYIYIVFPVYFWREAISRAGGSLDETAQARTIRFGGGLKLVARGVLVIAALLGMVVCAVRVHDRDTR